MSWKKLLTPRWVGKTGAASLLNTTIADVEARLANAEFVTRNPTPNVTEIKFHQTDGIPKNILAVPGAPDPKP